MPSVILLKSGSSNLSERQWTLTELPIGKVLSLLRIDPGSRCDALPEPVEPSRLADFAGFDQVFVGLSAEEEEGDLKEGYYPSLLTPAEVLRMFPDASDKMTSLQFGDMVHT